MILLALICSLNISVAAQSEYNEASNELAVFSSRCQFGNGNEVDCRGAIVLKNERIDWVVVVQGDSDCKFSGRPHVITDFDRYPEENPYTFWKTYPGDIDTVYTACFHNLEQEVIGSLKVKVYGYSD